VKRDERVPFEKKIRIFLFVPSCVCDFPGMFCFYYVSRSLSNAYTFLEGEELRKHGKFWESNGLKGHCPSLRERGH
jgi:hypothetical protein